LPSLRPCPPAAHVSLQALIPFYTGRIIDYASIDPDRAAFRNTTLKMLGVALGCAIFTGIRGGLFTVGGCRAHPGGSGA
jgi:ATP-binding cassette subfamily B (MDR/TAP) protein 9